MPNGLGPPPIFMPDDFSSNAGFTRTASCGTMPSRVAGLQRLLVLPLRFEVDDDAGGDRLRQSRPASCRDRRS